MCCNKYCRGYVYDLVNKKKQNFEFQLNYRLKNLKVLEVYFIGNYLVYHFTCVDKNNVFNL